MNKLLLIASLMSLTACCPTVMTPEPTPFPQAPAELMRPAQTLTPVQPQ
jgi:hypothetical protein